MKKFNDSINIFKDEFKAALEENKCDELKNYIIAEHVKNLSDLIFYKAKFALKRRLTQDLVKNENDKSFCYLKNNVYVNKENVEKIKNLLNDIENLINENKSENIEDEYLKYINEAEILSKCKMYQELYGIYLKICRMMKFKEIMVKELVITTPEINHEDLFN